MIDKLTRVNRCTINIPDNFERLFQDTISKINARLEEIEAEKLESDRCCRCTIS